MYQQRFDNRREPPGRRDAAQRRGTQRRAEDRRVDVRRTTAMEVPTERRELSDRRVESRRGGPDRRCQEERRLGARREDLERLKIIIAAGYERASHRERVYGMRRAEGTGSVSPEITAP